MSIYGINEDLKLTPEAVRDAIVNCFCEAHCADSGLTTEDDKELSRDYCLSLVKKAFQESGNDFEKPNKESLLAVIDRLADFAKNFRQPEVIKEHYEMINKLINKLE